MQNIENQQCIAGGSQCLKKHRYWVYIEAECRCHPFLSVKEVKKMFWMQKNNNPSSGFFVFNLFCLSQIIKMSLINKIKMIK